ncbi:MAG: hypothetical protein KDB86_08880 [Actinobacteria bacterium]|nr:hypothetical protein [Actinomycetota bacterium]MCB9390548.1 hypothetical protein [Acidimicrobiia bacterium]
MSRQRPVRCVASAALCLITVTGLSACGGSSDVTVVGGETTLVDGDDPQAPFVVTDSEPPTTFLITPAPPATSGRPTQDGFTNPSIVQNTPGDNVIAGVDESPQTSDAGWLAVPNSQPRATDDEVCEALDSALNFADTLSSADPNDPSAVKSVMDDVVRGAAVLVQELSGDAQRDALSLQNAFVGIRVAMQSTDFDLVALRESPRISQVEGSLEQAELSAGRLDALAAQNCPSYTPR